MGKLQCLLAIALFAIGCQHTPIPHDEGLLKNWRDTDGKPTPRERARMDEIGDKWPFAQWYLEQIAALASVEEHGPTSAQLAVINNGILQRMATAHPMRTHEQSWNRIRLAYIHALDKSWEVVGHKLIGDPPGSNANGWPEWRAASIGTQSLGEMLDPDPANAGIPSVMKAGGCPEDQLTRVIDTIKALPDPPFPNHSAASAWAHAYLSVLYATDPGDGDWQRIADWIICELTGDA